jgi:hypothetical protein
MKKIVLLIAILMILSQKQILGFTVHRNQIQKTAIAFVLKNSNVRYYSGNIETIDFGRPADWFTCDSDSAFEREYLKRMTIQDGKYWAKADPIYEKEIRHHNYAEEYSAYYHNNIVFYLFSLHLLTGPCFTVITSWEALYPEFPDSIKYIGAQLIITDNLLENFVFAGSEVFSDKSILLAFSNVGKSKICIVRGITLTDFERIYEHDWDKAFGFKIELNGRWNDAETTYVGSFDYLRRPAYQFYEIIKYDRAIPLERLSYVKLNKIETRIIDLWDLAQKRFHIKGKYDRYE